MQVTVRVGLALYAHFMGAQSWEAKGRMNDQPRTGHSEETGLGPHDVLGARQRWVHSRFRPSPAAATGSAQALRALQ